MSSAVESIAAAGSAFADELRQALAVANLPTLLSVLHQLTGDQQWLEAPYRPTPARGLSDHDDAGLPPRSRTRSETRPSR